jgi:large subunit ribosomal protein L29
MSQDKALRDQSVEELRALSVELARDLFLLRSERRTGGKVEQPHLFREKRRERARVLTLLNEKCREGKR